MPKVTNSDRLRRKLRAMPDAVKRQMQPAMETGAQEIVDFAYSLAPLGSTGALRASIDWSWGPAPRGSISGAKGLREGGEETLKGELLITVYAGNEVAYYARWVEFGTRPGQKGTRATVSGRNRKVYRTHPGTPAQPFFFPAYRALRKRVSNRIVNATRRAIRSVATSTG